MWGSQREVNNCFGACGAVSACVSVGEGLATADVVDEVARTRLVLAGRIELYLCAVCCACSKPS